jgi:cyclase
MKKIIFTLAILAAATPFAATDMAVAQQAPQAPNAKLDDFALREAIPTTLKQVRPDLYFLYDDLSSNVAFWVTDEGVLVIDSRQHPAMARDLIERIRKVTDKPIKWLVNTHAHGDHFLGNPEFKKLGTTIISHRDTRLGMIKNKELEVDRRMAFFKSMNYDFGEVKVVLPDVTFEEKLVIHMGGKTAEIFYLGAGQNPGDTFVHFPEDRVLFIGGPFARKNWSNMSFTPSIENWAKILRTLANMDVDMFLPGHGDVGTKQDVLDEADLVEDVNAGVKKAIADGKTKDEIRQLDFSKYKDLRNYNRRANFLEALYHLNTTGKPTFPYGKGT